MKEDPHLVANGRRRRSFQCLEANRRKRRRFIFTFSHFHLFPFSPQATLLRALCFSFEIKVLLYHGSRSSFTHFFPFPWPINYDHVFWCHKSPIDSFLIEFGWNFFLFCLEVMVSRMAMFYRLRFAQVNEKPALESYLDLTLTQHLRDEEPESREVRVHLETNPPRAWYYYISLNFCTLVILLQVDPTSEDEPETIYEGC